MELVEFTDFIHSCKQKRPCKVFDLLQEYYLDLLKTFRFREIKYYKIYPLIVELQDIERNEEHLMEQRLDWVICVLAGKEDYSYNGYIQLEKREDLDWLQKIWKQYQSGGHVLLEDADKLHEAIENITMDKISDVYFKKLLCLLDGLPVSSETEIMINSLYVSEINKPEVQEDIEKLFDILNGNRAAFISVEYKKTGINFVCM